MRMIDIIEKKKEGFELTNDEIAFFVKGFTSGEIPDYQASALLMAIYFNSMTDGETACLTSEMAKSGDTLDLTSLGDMTVDKHSSGGVGDKTTLIVAPIVAAAGSIVAKMSGRGLGFTGGTIDKLESVNKLSTSLSKEDFINEAKKIGLVVASQTGNMAPCDKKLYALRDVTATVDSMPLIASSIMSKKLASGAKSIVLDVKCGSGAFMKSEEDAINLARHMVEIGKNNNRNVCALITNMDTPLGYAIGNSLEIKEVVQILKGKKVDDLIELSLNLSSYMISLSQNISFDEAFVVSKKMLQSNMAYEKLLEMLNAQGANVKDGFENDLETAKYSYEYRSNCIGYIDEIDALTLGEISVLLGAGRTVKEDEIDYTAGILLNKKEGDKVISDELILTLYSNSLEKIDKAIPLLNSAFSFGNYQKEKKPLIRKIIK